MEFEEFADTFDRVIRKWQENPKWQCDLCKTVFGEDKFYELANADKVCPVCNKEKVRDLSIWIKED